MPWIAFVTVWFRSHVTQAQVRAHYADQGRVRATLTGGRRIHYRSHRTGRLVSYGAFQRWGPSRITAERWRQWLVERWERRAPPPKVEEWEVTLRYGVGRKVNDVTVRLQAKDPGEHTKEQVARAFWFAHKHGAAALTAWDIVGVDWQRGARTYRYPTRLVGVNEVIRQVVGLTNTVGLDGLRVARVSQ